MPVRLFKHEEMSFVHYGGPPGNATISRLVGPESSQTMGAGIAKFDGCSIEWTVLYDELIVCIEGLFRLRADHKEHEAGPGDVIWIPENTTVRYEGNDATVFYALYPANWKKRAGVE